MANNRNYLAGAAGNLISSLTQVFDPTGIAYNVNDASVVIGTGIFRPLLTTDLFAQTYLYVSGLSLTVGSVAVTGNPNVTVSNTVLPVSGVVQANITNTSPIPVSGATQTNITNTAPLAVSGVVISSTSTSSTSPNSLVSGINNVGFGTPLPANTSRKAWAISNLATGAILVRFSSSLPTTGTFNVLLKGASAPYAGDGATWTDSPAIWTGPVSVTGVGGAPIVFTCWEL